MRESQRKHNQHDVLSIKLKNCRLVFWPMKKKMEHLVTQEIIDREGSGGKERGQMKKAMMKLIHISNVAAMVKIRSGGT